MRNGYLTVYLSLSLTLLLSLILTMIEGARMSTVRMEAECVADIGMNSVLAEYHRELLEQYDLLFVDMSYGSKQAEISNTQAHLRDYMQHNFAVGRGSLLPVKDWLSLNVDRVFIDEYALASDEGGTVMRAQALDYMKRSTPEGFLAGLADQAADMERIVETTDVAGERNRIQAQIDGVELPVIENEEGELVESSLDNPADAVNSYRGFDILNLVLPDMTQLSNSAVNTTQYVSHRAVNAGNGFTGNKGVGGVVEELLFDEYLFEKCGRYGDTLDKSLLKYQIEYILMGEGTDRDNLKKVVNRLLLWREAANVVYLLSDGSKCAQAEMLALTISVVLQVPALIEPVKYSILFAWAYIESLSDIKILLKGGKVPIMKTAAEWKTQISSLIGFGGSVSESGGSENGLSYKEYLGMMLLLERGEQKNKRAMDIMEMDIRQTTGNAFFRMDGCFSSFAAEIEISSGFGYYFKCRQRYGFY